MNATLRGRVPLNQALAAGGNLADLYVYRRQAADGGQRVGLTLFSSEGSDFGQVQAVESTTSAGIGRTRRPDEVWLNGPLPGGPGQTVGFLPTPGEALKLSMRSGAAQQATALGGLVQRLPANLTHQASPVGSASSTHSPPC